MNKSLFSGHFLHKRLPAMPEWAEDPAPLYAALLPLWQRAQRLGEHWSEAQTEDEFIKPVLDLLGWSYTVQAKSRRAGQISRPDYALFVDAAAKDAATPFQGQDDAFFGRAAAVGEAKHWGRPLSHTSQSQGDTWKADRNPSHQMVGYLVGSRVEWGILTNGREWRLYSREVSSVASEFYSVDLTDIFPTDAEELPTPEQLDACKRWWLFFRRDAFVTDGQGKTFVQQVHEGSNTYAREISDKLKEIVFEEVMPAIAGGFVAYRHNEAGVATESEADLRRIYAASLSLLYKLLFLLYGEARNLLPMDNAGYRYESLTQMAARFAVWRDAQRSISAATHATGEYDRLLALFHRVDRGDPSLAIPRYNGGLFDPLKPDNAFLESHKLSDRAVAEAVDLLVRDRGEAVDYAYIDVRNLGAIYEGLLENRLRVIDAATGRVELVNDKGERKASGSYYTPDYIVKYIVEQTLQPLLDERAADFAAAMERVVDVRRRLQSREAESAGGNRLLQNEREKWERAAREAFLGITVCDPAMGSGHFLVNAVDYLTDGIIERLQVWHDAHPQVQPGWNPLYGLIGEVRRQIEDEMAAQAIRIDTARLDDTALLTRLVMKRCIYGVDLNPMAVELAKLSLWLHSFTVGAPLSFLDHHLRWGNSLIGADVKTVENALNSVEIRRKVSKEAQRVAQLRGEDARQETVAQQSGFFSGPFAGLLDLTEIMLRVAGGADATLADVRRSAREFADFEENLIPYKRVLDLWVSQYFGNSHALEFIDLHRNEVIPTLRDGRSVSASHAGAIERAKELWQAKRFFHWDLEFPEVFVDLQRRDWKENPGFDAVIGNPPYVSAWSMHDTDEELRNILELLTRIPDVLSGHWDMYIAFMTIGHAFCKKDGYCAFIIPNPFAREKYALNLRKYLLEHTVITNFRSFDELNVFEGVSRLTIVPVFKKTIPNLSSATVSFDFSSNNSTHSLTVPQAIFLDMPEYQLRGDRTPEQLELLAKISKRSSRLGDICYVNYGAQVSSRISGKFNKSDVITTKPIGNAKLFFDGKSLSRYEIVWDGRYLDYRSEEMYGPRTPELFESPKIVFRYVTGANEQLIVSFDSSGFYCDHLIICATYYDNVEGTSLRDNFQGYHRMEPPYPSIHYMVATLASKLLTWYYRQVFATGSLQGSYSQTYPQQVRAFPIRRIDFTTPADERAQAVAAAQSLYAACLASGDDAPLLAFVDDCLSPRNSQLAPRTDVIHDLLAFLAEQMIDANKAKQTEMAGFLAWLETETGWLVDDLSGKTTLQNYLGDYQKDESPAALTDLLDVLRKNKRKLTVDPSSRTFQEALKREYAASLDKLLPIKARLARTDRLIDRIVYRLYGLTEEEIAIVEGGKGW